MKMSEIEMK